MSPSSSAARRVLVVEDEVMVAMLLEDVVADLGWDVVGPVARIEQALAAIDRDEIDAAILDVNLDGQPSYGVAAALTARQVPFVFVTGYGRSGLDPAFQDRPVVQKPFTGQMLEQALGRLVAG